MTAAEPANGPFYIGIDVGTGSARACIIDSNGEILAVASKAIQRWEPMPDYYVCLIHHSDPQRPCVANAWYLESIIR
jgi:ribulose kinase